MFLLGLILGFICGIVIGVIYCNRLIVKATKAMDEAQKTITELGKKSQVK